jgi:RecG-like helicase
MPKRKVDVETIVKEIKTRKDKIRRLEDEIIQIEKPYVSERIKDLAKPIESIMKFEVIDVPLIPGKNNCQFKITTQLGTLNFPLDIRCSNGLVLVHTDMPYNNEHRAWYIGELKDTEASWTCLAPDINKMTQNELARIYQAQKSVGEKLMKVLHKITLENLCTLWTEKQLDELYNFPTESDLNVMYHPVKQIKKYQYE